MADPKSSIAPGAKSKLARSTAEHVLDVAGDVAGLSERQSALAETIAAVSVPVAALVGQPGVWFCNSAWRERIGFASEAREPELRPLFDAALSTLVEGAAPVRRRIASASESEVEFDLHFSALRDSSGALEGLLATAVDVSVEVAATNRVRAQRLEFRHQIGNLLSVIRSISGHGSRTDQAVDEFTMHLSDRIDALARIQSKLTREGAASIDLEELIFDQVAAQAGGATFSLEGPSLALAPQMGEALGLTFHELATNALKFGALSRQKGQLSISWSVQKKPSPRLRIVWQEQGVQVAALAPRSSGFGLTFIQEAVAYELDGEVRHTLAPGGLVCELFVPLPAKADRRHSRFDF